jgi:Tc toxin complex TcA C-terminal TcB-binding domain
MEKAYLDENRREYELTKHISLRLDFPAAYLRLRTAGQCEISIPEWMFDLDYPGHYMRRIAAVKLTAPVVTSAFTGVHCRVTLLSSMTRIHPETRPPAHHCCGDGQDRSEYEPCPDDPRIVRDYAARESIATSSGQDDPGLFELNFRDERYLPFEYQGAVSRWRIELPPENNYFDLDTLTDLVLHVSYRAREGGAALRDAAAQDARRRLPGDGLRLFDVRHDFPDAWPELRGLGAGSRQQGHEHRRRRLRLGFTPRMFPFVPERGVLGIDGLVLMFAAPDDAPGRHHLVRFWSAGDGHDEADRDDVIEFECVADEAWPGFFCGTIDLRERPLHLLADDRPTDCTFEFPAQAGDIRDAFVVAHYETQHRPRNGLTTAEG